MQHGGDIYRNNVEYDFSVNINPLPIPEKIIKAMQASLTDVKHYPDACCQELREKLEKYTGISKECILVGNGASELIMHVFMALKPKCVFMETPSFSEYRRAALAAGAHIVSINERASCEDKIKALSDNHADMLVLARPNNPTGYMEDEGEFYKLLDYCDEHGIAVLLDECFYSLSIRAKDEYYSSLVTTERLKASENLIVLRAFTKCYGIPGVRLGVAFIGGRAIRDKINMTLPQWNVSMMAQRVGMACLESPEYVEAYRRLIETEGPRMCDFLRKSGFVVYESSTCFILFRSEVELYGGLLEKGILIRDCANMISEEGYFYRIAIKTAGENEILMDAIEEILNEQN